MKAVGALKDYMVREGVAHRFHAMGNVLAHRLSAIRASHPGESGAAIVVGQFGHKDGGQALQPCFQFQTGGDFRSSSTNNL